MRDPTPPCQDWRGRGEWLKRKLFGSRKREYNSHFLVARSPCRACAAFKNARGAGRSIQANEREAGGLLVAPRAGAERGNIGRRPSEARRGDRGRSAKSRALARARSACFTLAIRRRFLWRRRSASEGRGAKADYRGEAGGAGAERVPNGCQNPRGF